MAAKRQKQDFNFSQLPDTRRKVFFDRLKIEWGKLFVVGVILLVFFLPLMAILIVKDLGVTAIYAEYESGNISVEQAKALAASAGNMLNALSIAGFVVFAVGLACVMPIIKRLAWIEPVFMRADLVDGLKGNTFCYAISFAIFGFMLWIATFALGYFDSFILSVMPTGVAVVVFLPILLYTITLTNVYNMGFSETIKTAFSLFIRSAWQALIAVFIICVLAATTIINNIIIKYLLLAAEITFICPIMLLIWFLFCCSVFDKYINETQFPEIYKKGLYVAGQSDENDKK